MAFPGAAGTAAGQRDESVEWYYFNKDGEPKTGPEFGKPPPMIS